MTGGTRSGRYGYVAALCLLTFVLLVAWSATTAAQVGGGPGDDSAGGPRGSGEPHELPPAPVTPTPTPGPTATPGPTPKPGEPAPAPTTPIDPTLTELEIRAALAPNRIVFHPATPVQLCKVGDGLQVYFIGADGKTYFGPWVPSFAELAATYPEGESASIYSGRNPLTGKAVSIDYLPSKHKLRVSTFYADRPPHAIDKPYVYTVDHIHNITHEQW